MITITRADFLSILPHIVLISWASVLLLLDVFWLKRYKAATAVLAVIGLVFTLGLTIALGGRTRITFGGMLVLDKFATFLNVLFLGSGILAVALAYTYLQRLGINRGEYYVLLLFSITGMMLMAAAADLIIVFLALELLSFPLYVLAAFAKPRPESEEAGLKYFLLGAFASGFLLYGVALTYGATGTSKLSAIHATVTSGSADLDLLVVGAGLVLVGLGFKVAVVPFHMWTPDVYQGAPSSVTGFMAVGAKAAGFAAIMRIFIIAYSDPILAADLTPVVWVLSALTMILGNVTAIAQRNIKRMLAYSSIAHAGYILMAFTAFGNADLKVQQDAVAAALFYLLGFAITSFGVWAVVILLEKKDGLGLELNDYAGLGRKHIGLAVAMTVFMLSFIGIPPTLGFAGKFFLFRTVMEAGFIGLALIGVLTALVSAFFYLRLVVIMFMRDGEPETKPDLWLQLTVGGAAVLTVLLSIFASPLFRWAADAVLKIK